MKKILVSFALIAFSGFAFAQGDFNKSMSEKIAKLETTDQADDLGMLASEFDKLGVQQNSWLTYYYASYAYVKRGNAFLAANKTAEADDAAGMAEKYALVAKEKNATSSEVPVLMSMIHTLRMRVAPEKRFTSESALSTAELAKATKMDAKNPRISLAKAEQLYFLPTEFGGSKVKAKEMYLSALEQFKTYKPANAISPNWGKKEAVTMIEQSK